MELDKVVFLHDARSNVDAFLKSVGLGSEQLLDPMLALIDALKSCREEGSDLRPEFYIFREKDHSAFRSETGAQHAFELCSSKTKGADSFAHAVKHAAPMAQGVWAGFIKLRQKDFAYGVIRRRYSVVDEAIFENPMKKKGVTSPFIRVRQIERDVVRLTGPRARLEIRFSASGRTTPGDAVEHRDALLDKLTEKCSTVKTETRALLGESFDRALNFGHGFLIGVTESQDEGTKVPVVPESLRKRGLLFNEWVIPTPHKVASLVEMCSLKQLKAPCTTLKAHTERVIKKYAELEAWTHLISNLLISDGITLFDNRGRVLGYRIFIYKNAKDEDREQSGGARLRAFHAMESLFGSGDLIAAFYQSQDGQNKFSKRERKLAPGKLTGLPLDC